MEWFDINRSSVPSSVRKGDLTIYPNLNDPYNYSILLSGRINSINLKEKYDEISKQLDQYENEVVEYKAIYGKNRAFLAKSSRRNIYYYGKYAALRIFFSKNGFTPFEFSFDHYIPDKSYRYSPSEHRNITYSSASYSNYKSSIHVTNTSALAFRGKFNPKKKGKNMKAYREAIENWDKDE